MGFLIKSLLGIFGGTTNVVLSTLLSVVKTVGGEIMSLIKEGANATLQYHQEGISFARSMGMTLKESQSYTSVLIERASELGIKYGIAADKALELQRNLSEATGRATMLNNADAEKFVQINKLVGSDVSNAFTSTIMNNLGGQISTVEGAISKAYTTAAKSGLSAASFSKKVADNLGLANKYSFRDGVDGITRMTVMSEKLGVDMKSIASSIDHFLDLTDAIEGSAKLNMLGGAAAAIGSNPLTMSYEANYDPEAFLERMKDTLGGYASFDAKSGMATVNGMNRDFVANIAKALGVSMEDAMSMAKKQSEIKYKESAFGGQLSQYSNEEKDFILNKSYIGKDGQLKMTDSNYRERNVNDLASSGELSQMMTMSKMSAEDFVMSQAMSLTSIQEAVLGIKTAITADAAKSFQKVLPRMQRSVEGIGMNLRDALSVVWPNIADGVSDILTYLQDNMGVVKDVFDTAKNIFSVLSDNFKTVIGILIGLKVLKGLGGIYNAFKSGYRFFGGPSVNPPVELSIGGGGSMGANSSLGSRIASTIRTSKVFNFLTGGQTRTVMDTYSFARNGSGRIRSAMTAIGRGLKTASRATKIAGALGGVVGALELGNALGSYYSTKNDLDSQLKSGAISQREYNSKLNEAKTEKNAGVGSAISGTLGAAIGTALGGPVGTAIGGFLGGKAGELIGKHWVGITNTVSSASKSVGNAVTSALKSFGEWLKSGIKSLLNGIVSVVKGYFNTIAIIPRAISSWNKVKESYHRYGFWSTVGKLYKGGFATGGIVGGNSYHGDNVRANVNSGEMILTMPQQRELFDILNSKYSRDNVKAKVNSGVNVVLYKSSDTVKAKPVGNKEYIYKPSKSSLGGTSSEVKVNDFNVNISGTIRLDGGRNSKDIDISKLLSNQEFVSSLKEMIKTSINNDINCGKLMNDDALRRGMPAQTSLWGRK